MEIWDILDENGNKTGRTIDKSDPMARAEGVYHQGVDVWIINSDNKILIQKRAPQKKLEPNVWAMTGGSVIKGETEIETIKREAFEELGIELDMEHAVKELHYRTGNVWVEGYIVRQDIDLDKVIMQPNEVSEVKFATYEEIEEIYSNDLFIKNRWEFVRDKIKKYIGSNFFS